MKTRVLLLAISVLSLLYSCKEDKQDNITNYTNYYNIEEKDFWDRTNGPYSALINRIYIGKNNEVFAGSYTEGLHYSTDNGTSWKKITNDITGDCISSYVLTNKNILYLVINNNQVFQSTDLGASWKNLSTNIDSLKSIYLIGADLKENIFALVQTGKSSRPVLCKSSGQCEKWNKVDSSGNFNSSFIFNADLDNIYFSYSESNNKPSKVITSSDEGNSWHELKSLNSFNDVFCSLILNGSEIYAITTYQGCIYKSTDAGNTWKKFISGLYKESFSGAVMNSKGYLYIAASTGIYRSMDKGQTWQLILKYSYYGSNYIKQVVFNKENYLYAVMYYGAIYKSKEPFE